MARLNVGGDLDVDVGRDLGLLGARIHAGGDADIDVAGDLTIKTLQDISESSNFSAGLSVTIGPSGPTSGSANFAAGNSERQRSLDGLAALTAGGVLDADIGGTTEITGGIIGSESGALDLTTTSLVLNDLTERERSRQVGVNASFGNTLTDSGGAEFGVTGGGGSFSSAALDGTTRATIGQGTVTVRDQSEDETAAQLAETNRDINNATTITRDTSFDTGNIFIDIGAARRAEGNIGNIRELTIALNEFRDNVIGDEQLRQFIELYNRNEQIGPDYNNTTSDADTIYDILSESNIRTTTNRNGEEVIYYTLSDEQLSRIKSHASGAVEHYERAIVLLNKIATNQSLTEVEQWVSQTSFGGSLSASKAEELSDKLQLASNFLNEFGQNGSHSDLGDVGLANLSREIAVVHRPVDGSLPVVIFDQDDLFSAEQRTLPQFQGAKPNNFSDAELITGHELGLHVGARFAAEGALLEIYGNAVRNNPSLSTLFTHNVDDFILRLARIRGIDNLPERKDKE